MMDRTGQHKAAVFCSRGRWCKGGDKVGERTIQVERLFVPVRKV